MDTDKEMKTPKAVGSIRFKERQEIRAKSPQGVVKRKIMTLDSFGLYPEASSIQPYIQPLGSINEKNSISFHF